MNVLDEVSCLLYLGNTDSNLCWCDHCKKWILLEPELIKKNFEIWKNNRILAKQLWPFSTISL